MLVPTQQLRFPSIDWYPRGSSRWGAEKERHISAGAVWLGVGDTPFQVSSGDWLVRHLVREAMRLKNRSDTPMLMIGVGAEEAIRQAKSPIAPVLDRIDYIWARDSHSAEILCDIGLRPEKINVSADLAHLSLSRLFPTPMSSPGSALVGVNYFAEKYEKSDLEAIHSFSQSLAREGRLVFISTEVRRKMERSTFEKIHSIRRLSFPFFKRKVQTIPEFIFPNYAATTVRELLAPIVVAETLISSRYHGLMAAAWAGRRVGILGGRSSKIAALAEELKVPIVMPPYNTYKLREVYEDARIVDRSILEAKRDDALNSIIKFRRYAGV